MHFKNVILSSALLFGSHLSSNAQSFIPPNADFEMGTTTNWSYYRGTVATGHIFTLTGSSATPGLHAITSGSGTDMYGGFPVVGHGSYSLKLAHDTIDNNADGASYNIHVPATGSYTFDYYYAAVLQGSAHVPGEQSVMEITAIDSATGSTLPSSTVTLLPSSVGFLTATTGTDVHYQPWTAASFNLAGYGGHTIIVKFTVAACGTGAHFGYGYVDVSGVNMSAATTAPSVVAAKAVVNITPNPTSGVLNIQWANQKAGNASLEIKDVAGRVVSKSTLNMNTASGETQLNLGSLTNGIYFVNINSATINFSNRIVVQK